jgi:thiol:disulfide interchange protein DsbC
MKTKTKVLLGIALAIASTLALGGPPDPGATAMLQKLKGLYPATRFTSVAGTPIDGVYEVVMGQNVAYVGGDGRHFLFGHLFDMRTQTDLTADKLLATGDETATQARQVNFATLPLQDAVKMVKGDGSRRLAVFSDPRCPYCKALDEELAKLDNVTVYTFLLPWLGPESRPAAEALWADAVPDRANDTTVLDRNLKLASQLGLRGTPMLIASDGRVSEGARSAEALDAWLTLKTREVASRTSVDKGQP